LNKGIYLFRFEIKFHDFNKAYDLFDRPTRKDKKETDTKIGLSDTSSKLPRESPTCVGFSEIDPFANAVLRYRFPSIKNYGDITKIDWTTVPDFDLLVGGSPCQDFSVAGKREGIAGRRSGLFNEYVRALEEKRPDSFIWENVKGVMSSGGGWDFARILTAFSEAGYSLWWQVLNARDFGVPQNRERVFVVGTCNGSPREVFFERQGDTKNEKIFAKTLNSSDWRGANRNQGQNIVRCPLRYLERNQKNIVGDYAFTVDASQTAGVTDGSRVRRLMPIECERLMSWPENHTKYGSKEDGTVYEMSDSQRYKMCGNGVVSKVIEEIMKAHFL